MTESDLKTSGRKVKRQQRRKGKRKATSEIRGKEGDERSTGTGRKGKRKATKKKNDVKKKVK